MMKSAMLRVRQGLAQLVARGEMKPQDAFVVLQVHDEIGMTCSHAVSALCFVLRLVLLTVLPLYVCVAFQSWKCQPIYFLELRPWSAMRCETLSRVLSSRSLSRCL